MKDYKRLTKRNADGSACYALPLTSSFIGAIYEEQKERDGEILRRLADLEDKIESGELCDRKETAREIYNWLVEHSYDEESRQLVKVFHESFLEDEE